MKKVGGLLLLLLLSQLGARAYATGVSFQDPNDWNLGDSESTFQEWNANLPEFIGDPNGFQFQFSGTLPSDSNVNPAISSHSTMGVNPPGYVASSGGYYNENGDYSLFANIYNHGGSSGSGGPYDASYGTRVIVQTASSTNQDPNAGGPAGIFPDTLELVQLDGSPLTGGDNANAMIIAEISDPNELVPSPFGLVQQQEYFFEFWLPGYTDDFRVETDLIIHASFQHLRVDTFIVQEASGADFNGDGRVDGLDFLTWQRSPDAHGGANGLAAWESQYESGGISASVIAIPEPSTAILLLAGMAGIGCLDARGGR